MSNALAIAAVTATLRNLLTLGVTLVPDLADTIVTTHVPDAARNGGTTANQINLFLYQAVPNAAWRNVRRRGRSGGVSSPRPDAVSQAVENASHLLTLQPVQGSVPASIRIDV